MGGHCGLGPWNGQSSPSHWRDFNEHWQTQPALATMVDAAELVDPLLCMEGPSRKATFKTGSVLDHFLVTPGLFQRLLSGGTSDFPTPADHMSLDLHISTALSTSAKWPRLKYAKPFPDVASKPFPGELESIASWARSFRRAIEEKDVDEALRVWSCRWEELLHQRCQHYGEDGLHQARGRDALPLTQHLEPRHRS